MILTIHVPPLVSGQRLCYIDRVQLGVPQKNSKKMESPDMVELDRFFVQWETQIIGLTLPYQDSPFF